MTKTNKSLQSTCATLVSIVLTVAWSPACLSAESKAEHASVKTEQTFEMTSSAFQQGQTVPKQHTGDGKDTSPPLHWAGVPEKTQSFVLICDDPDAPAGTWVHWVVYDIPAAAREFKEAVPREQRLPDGSKQGSNSSGKIGYNGPSPPAGNAHRYFFKLYAVDKAAALKPGATKQQVMNAIKGHTLAEAELMGTYKR